MSDTIHIDLTGAEPHKVSARRPLTDRNGCLVCPVCGDDYVHLTAAGTLTGGDNEHDDPLMNRLPPANPSDGTGRTNVYMYGYCEAGKHEFVITFVQHEGVTRVISRSLEVIHEVRLNETHW